MKKKLFIPSSWYFCIGYWVVIFYVLYYAVKMFIDSYTTATLLDAKFWITGIIVETLILSLPVSLATTRAAYLASVYVFLNDQVKCYTPFRKTRVVFYSQLSFSRLALSTYGRNMVAPYLYLASRSLSQNEMAHPSISDKNSIIITLRISLRRCIKLAAILPPKLGAPIHAVASTARTKSKRNTSPKKRRNTQK